MIVSAINETKGVNRNNQVVSFIIEKTKFEEDTSTVQLSKVRGS